MALIYEYREKVPAILTELFATAKATLLNGYRLSTIAPGAKTDPEFCMLQTSDLLAYEAAKHLYNFDNDAGRGTRKAFSRLMENVHQAEYMDIEAQRALKSWAQEASGDERLL